MLMLITLTILLPLVHTVAGTQCHAEPRQTGNTSTLPKQVLEQLEKEGDIIWNNQTSLTVYYVGYPDVKEPNRRFIAACAGGLENRASHNCVNATWIDGEEGGHNITVAEFLKFYTECSIDADFNKLKEEDEDDYDKEKNEDDEELEELGKAAGVIN